MIIVNNYDKEGNEINPNEIKITDLVIYEIGDSNNKLYQELLTMTFNNRMLDRKYNMLILETII